MNKRGFSKKEFYVKNSHCGKWSLVLRSALAFSYASLTAFELFWSSAVAHFLIEIFGFVNDATFVKTFCVLSCFLGIKLGLAATVL